MTPRRKFELVLPQAAKDRAATVILEHDLAGDFVILHPGSARSEKFWMASRWAEVANQEGIRFVLTGGKSRMEQDHIARIKSHLQRPVLDLSGQLDLLTLAALIARARLLVTIDSAPMHLAAALGTPQVALFGPTNPYHWRPRTSPTLVLRAGQVNPLAHFVPQQGPGVMKEISTKQVIDAIRRLLSSPTAPVA